MLYLISVIIFFAVLAVLIYRDKKIQVVGYILFMRRTKRFRSIIDRTAKRLPRFWKFFGTIAVISSFVFMAVGLFLMFMGANFILAKQITEPAASLILPTPTPQPVSAPGVIGIPFWFWIIAVAVIMVPHEFMHGVLARVEKVRLKSVGLLLLLIIPGAFVEPDERQLKKKRLLSKLRVFAVGSFINIIIGLALLMLASQMWHANVQPGLLITSVNQSSPAYASGLRPGMVIQSIGDREMETSFWDYSFLILRLHDSASEKAPNRIAQLMLFYTLADYKPNETVKIVVNGEGREITLGENPSIKGFAYMGIGARLNAKNTEVFSNLYPLLAFVWLLSLFVGIFNMIPLYPLDGGQIVESFAERVSKKYGRKISRAVTCIVLLLLLFNFIGPYIV